MASESTEKYIDSLMFWLRMRNVPGERIGQIVAEVEAHVADSGEYPQEAFGRPREYAKEWARDSGAKDWPKRIRATVGVASAGAGGALTAIGGIRTAIGEELWGVHPFVALLAGLMLLAVAAFVTPREPKIVDPRTGREPERLRRAGRRSMLVLGTAVTLYVAFMVVVSVLVE